MLGQADQGQNVDIRIPPNNNPVTDVTSKDLTCNVNGLSGAGVSTATIPAGSNITFEWHQHAQRTGEDAISGGHKGPVQVFIAKAPSTAASFDGQGAVWTKIYSSGLLNAQSQQWATDIVNTDNGKHSVVIPASLPAGEYLLRSEIVRIAPASAAGLVTLTFALPLCRSLFTLLRATPARNSYVLTSVDGLVCAHLWLTVHWLRPSQDQRRW